jgi:hypothetical protein
MLTPPQSGTTHSFLAGAVVHRFQRALQDRDRVWFNLNRQTVGDAGEDALDALNDVLLRLMGAVDVTARVARVVLGLDEGAWGRSGSTSDGFRKAVRLVEPPLSDLFLDGTSHRLTLDALAGLRNTIHHTALPEIRVSEGRTAYRTRIEPRPPERDLVIAAADALGGRLSWGVEEPVPGDLHLDSGRLADQLIIHTAALIVAVQQATPVERLPGVKAGQLFASTTPIYRFGVDAGVRVRLQLGLGTDSDQRRRA